MSQHTSDPNVMERAFDAICMLLMPFFLLAAGDDPQKARAAVADLIRSHNPTNTQELDLAARVVGFSIAALDNLRLSLAVPDLSDTKILRYRSSAVSLSRSAEQCRVVLTRLRAEAPATAPVSAPTPRPPAAAPSPSPQPQRLAEKPSAPLPPMSNASLEKAKTEARAMLAGLAKLGAACAPGQGMTALRVAPEPGAQITAAVTAALTEMKSRGAAQQPPGRGARV